MESIRVYSLTEVNCCYRIMNNENEMNAEFNRLRICFADGDLKKSLFWLSHSNDGSLMVEIPYSSTSAIYYGSFKLPKNQPPADICYADFGQLTDVCPKFVYHNSGECHFSKTGKIGSEFKVQSRPIASIDRQIHVFTFYLNGLPESFRDFDENTTKKRDLKEHNFNVVFSAPAIRLAPNVRHRIKMMIEPDDNFYERHGLKSGRHFYKTSNDGYVFVYNLISNHRGYKCLLAYKELETGQSDEHFVFFGAVDPHDGSHGDDVSFIVGNC